MRRDLPVLGRLLGDARWTPASRQEAALRRLVRHGELGNLPLAAPGAQLASRLYQVEGKLPADFESPDHFFFRHHVTPAAAGLRFCPARAARSDPEEIRGSAINREREKGDRGDDGEKGKTGEKGESDLSKLAATWKTAPLGLDLPRRRDPARDSLGGRAGALAGEEPAASPHRQPPPASRLPAAKWLSSPCRGSSSWGTSTARWALRAPVLPCSARTAISRPAATSPTSSELCQTLARMGAVVFSYSMIGYNDSTQVPHHTPHAFTLQLWNSIPAVDFVSSLEIVDTKRIAVTGASGGGTQSFMLTAVEPRRRLLPRGHGLRGLLRRLRVRERAAGASRDGLRHQQRRDRRAGGPAAAVDRFLRQGLDEERAHPRAAVHSERIPAVCRGGCVRNVHLADEGHNYGPSKRQAVYAFLAEHLGLAAKPLMKPDGTIDESATVIESAAALAAFDASHPRPADALQGERAILKALAELQRSRPEPK